MIPTPHITAKEGDFARTVLMPGDPLRAKFIAENYLEDAVLVNNTRGVQGYTGYYKGKRVSVMASGMGMPSIGIYSYELFNFYGVENIIRVGSAGMLSEKLQVRDVVVGMSAYTNSSYGDQFGFKGHVAPSCSWELLKAAVETGERLGVHVVPGALYSGRAGRRNGSGSPVPQRRQGRQECPVHLHHLRQSLHRRGPERGRTSEYLHQNDGNCFGNRLIWRFHDPIDI